LNLRISRSTSREAAFEYRRAMSVLLFRQEIEQEIEDRHMALLWPITRTGRPRCGRIKKRSAASARGRQSLGFSSSQP